MHRKPYFENHYAILVSFWFLYCFFSGFLSFYCLLDGKLIHMVPGIHVSSAMVAGGEDRGVIVIAESVIMPVLGRFDPEILLLFLDRWPVGSVLAVFQRQVQQFLLTLRYVLQLKGLRARKNFNCRKNNVAQQNHNECVGHVLLLWLTDKKGREMRKNRTIKWDVWQQWSIMLQRRAHHNAR